MNERKWSYISWTAAGVMFKEIEFVGWNQVLDCVWYHCGRNPLKSLRTAGKLLESVW